MNRYLHRVVGWSDDATVARAQRLIELAGERAIPLVIAGDEFPAAIAHAIHQRAGWSGGFVVVDPRRNYGRATVRSAASVSTVERATLVAGTICIDARRLPADLGPAWRVLERVRLVVVRPNDRAFQPHEIDPIIVPRLVARPPGELERIITEYLDETEMRWEEDPGERDRAIAWVRGMASSHDALEKACRRFAVVRRSPNLALAARELGMAPVSLGKWLARRASSASGLRRFLVEVAEQAQDVRASDDQAQEPRE